MGDLALTSGVSREGAWGIFPGLPEPQQRYKAFSLEVVATWMPLRALPTATSPEQPLAVPPAVAGPTSAPGSAQVTHNTQHLHTEGTT